MTDLTNPKWMWLKAILMLVIGLTAATLLLSVRFAWSTLLLLALVIWSFCRSYYFAFYVIEHYIDPRFKFSGLLSFLRYALRNHRKPPR
jgi:hypothetical protein